MREKKWVTQIRRGVVELLVLANVAKQETYGYQVLKELNELEGILLTESTVYPALARLKREGMLNVQKKPSPDGPSRLYYTLTLQGREHLDELVAYWRLLDQHVHDTYPQGESS